MVKRKKPHKEVLWSQGAQYVTYTQNFINRTNQRRDFTKPLSASVTSDFTQSLLWQLITVPTWSKVSPGLVLIVKTSSEVSGVTKSFGKPSLSDALSIIWSRSSTSTWTGLFDSPSSPAALTLLKRKHKTFVYSTSSHFASTDVAIQSLTRLLKMFKTVPTTIFDFQPAPYSLRHFLSDVTILAFVWTRFPTTKRASFLVGIFGECLIDCRNVEMGLEYGEDVVFC